MPKILVVAATAPEIAPFLGKHGIDPGASTGLFHPSGEPADLFVLITGAGMVNTAFEMGKLIGSRFDLVINAGIAGSFNRFEPGQVVNVTQDCFSELGAEDDQKFLSIDELGLGSQTVSAAHPFDSPAVRHIPTTNGITVNTVHGNERSIAKVTDKFQPHVETMEGAAFLMAANAFHWKCIQLRAISNKVSKRDRNSWNIQLAVEKLNETLTALVESVMTKKGK
jgi:futalosine hydrolase